MTGIRRAWPFDEKARVDTTEKVLAEVFRNLSSPFGEQVPFSHVPAQLTNMARGPPRAGKQVRTVTRQVQATWEDEREKSAMMKKCKDETKAGTIDDGMNTCRARKKQEFEEDAEKLTARSRIVHFW